MKFEHFPQTVRDDEGSPCLKYTEAGRHVPFARTALSNIGTPSPDFDNNNCEDGRLQRLENLSSLVRKQLVIIFFVSVLLLAGFVLLLAFIVRCDETALMSSNEDTEHPNDNPVYPDLAAMWKALVQDREENYKAQRIEWLPKKRFTDKIEPGGSERLDRGNTLLYVARTSHMNGTVVGKYWHYVRLMYFEYGRREFIHKEDCEILSLPPGSVSWLPIKKGEGLPAENTLILGGSAPITGEATYICRLEREGHLILGSILKSSGRCIAAYNKTYSAYFKIFWEI